MPAGRPKITTNDFPENWKAEVLALASEGASDVEIRGLLDICNDTFYRLIEDDSEFSETINKAKSLCRIWWEKNGRLNLENKDFSSTLWYMNMKNRFGWADKQEIATQQNIVQKLDLSGLSDDELRTLAEIQRKSGASPT